MHSDFLPTAASPSLWREEFLLTREEIAHGLYMTDPRKAGKVRILVESIVLVAAALYFLIGWLTSEQKTANGPILALTSLFVLVLLVFVYPLNRRQVADNAAALEKKRRGGV